jgi:hypothetical protein
MGRVGKSFVLRNRRSSSPMREMIVPGKGMILNDWGTIGEQWHQIKFVTSSLDSAKSRERMLATAFSFPGNHWV